MVSFFFCGVSVLFWSEDRLFLLRGVFLIVLVVIEFLVLVIFKVIVFGYGVNSRMMYIFFLILRYENI